VQDHIRQATVH